MLLLGKKPIKILLYGYHVLVMRIQLSHILGSGSGYWILIRLQGVIFFFILGHENLGLNLHLESAKNYAQIQIQNTVRYRYDLQKKRGMERRRESKFLLSTVPGRYRYRTELVSINAKRRTMKLKV